MQIVTLLAAAVLVVCVKADFYLESFVDDAFVAGRWKKSTDPKYADQPVMIKASDKPGKGFDIDKGLTLTQEMKHYGVYTEFKKTLDNKGKDLVIQYELKLEESLHCGGAYIKMPRASETLDLTKLNGDTPYSIMFGPDKCGHTNKVHFILQHQNPVSGEWEEKHFKNPPGVETDQGTHLYTLAIKQNNDFEIFVDMTSKAKGNLLKDMEPPINPSEDIDDPTDFKPADWVDVAKIPDADAVKPEDWDELAPRFLDDSTDSKPDGWGDDAPLDIPHPDAQKPTDWDDEEDGQWEAPTVPNPLCENIGCGQWKPRQLNNPDYRGPWEAPEVANPDYVGEWKPNQIRNPHYFVDNHPANIAPMAGMAVEVWTTTAGIHFDNFAVCHSLMSCFAFGTIWKEKEEGEMQVLGIGNRLNRLKVIKAKKATGDFKDLAEAAVLEAMNVVEDNFWPIMVTMLVTMTAMAIWVWKTTPGEFIGWTRKEQEEEEEEEEEEDEKKSDGGENPAEEVAESDEDENDEDEPAPTLRRRNRGSKK